MSAALTNILNFFLNLYNNFPITVVLPTPLIPIILKTYGKLLISLIK
nr:hypothetical protein [Candidatus Shikimatogenerans silvanidophilus]